MTDLEATEDDLSDAALAHYSAAFEDQPATAIISWATRSFGTGLVLLTSMTDAVLVDLATRVQPDIEVAFIDTRYHFAETLETVEAVRRRYSLDLRILTCTEPAVPAWQADPLNCCSAAKVAQLDRVLASKVAWMSGLRRTEASTRADAPIVSRDRRGKIKINPLATWTDEDVAGYVADHQVPVNPLLTQGYLSIGCQPCTRPVEAGADQRSGRWAHSAKTECGIHL
jgi:phosphoadenosine phosphosulfate reductase